MDLIEKRFSSKEIIVLLFIILGAIYLGLKEYLFFHLGIELFSIIIAFNMSIIALNTSHISKNYYFIFIGISYGCVGLFDLFHTVSYKGMNIFINYNACDLSIHLWLIARYIESISLLAAFWFLNKELKKEKLISVYVFITAILLFSTFQLELFPNYFIESSGLRLCKVVNECIILGLLTLVIILLKHNKEKLNQYMYKYMMWSVIITISSEIAFMSYVSPYGITTIIGHILKLTSFYFIYKAINETSFKKPYKTLFRKLKMANKELKKEKNKLFDVAEGILLVLDKQGRTTLINKRGCEILGYSKEEIIGKKMVENFVCEEDKARTRKAGKSLLKGEGKEFRTFENNILTKTGEKKRIVWRSTELKDEKGEIDQIFASGVDITERARLEEQLIRSEKLAEIGKLATGITHEFNNLLASMMGKIDLLLLRNKQNNINLIEDTVDKLKEIKSEGQQAKKLAYDILNISYSTEQETGSHDIKEITDEILGIQQRELDREGIKVIRNYSPVRNIKINSDELKQILLNLIINAKDAMIPCDKGKLEVSIKEADNEVKIKISDTGIGMDEETQKQIFKPFFTTKADLTEDSFDRKGNGIGLSVTKEIIEKHNGSIKVKSTKGEGTTFTVRLPISDENV